MTYPKLPVGYSVLEDATSLDFVRAFGLEKPTEGERTPRENINPVAYWVQVADMKGVCSFRHFSQLVGEDGSGTGNISKVLRESWTCLFGATLIYVEDVGLRVPGIVWKDGTWTLSYYKTNIVKERRCAIIMANP